MWKLLVFLTLSMFVTGCIPVERTVTPTAPLPETSPTHISWTATLHPTEFISPTLTLAPSPTSATDLPEEAILILEPGAGSRLADSIYLAGIAGPTFESHLLVQVILEDGSELVRLPIIIQAEMGSRGPFVVDIPFSVQEMRQAFILVSSNSPRDDGTTHLASVGVTPAPDGPAEIRPVESHSEQITITRPALGETLSGGVAHIEGTAIASFEGTLVVELLDGDGNVLVSKPLIVQAPEMGQYGTFAIDLPFQVNEPGAGRVVVRDPSVVFQGDVHLASVEVSLMP